MQILILRDRLPGLNEVLASAKSHYGAYSSMKRKVTLSVATQARADRLKPIQGKAIIEFHWYEPNKRRDPDNIRHGAKYILDGLVEAGVLQDDGQKYISGFTDYFRVDKSNPRVEVVIYEMSEAIDIPPQSSDQRQRRSND